MYPHPPEGHFPLLQLPEAALAQVVQQCKGLTRQNLRLACTALHTVAAPESIVLQSSKLNKGQQDLKKSRQLAKAWATAMHVDVLFDTATSSTLPDLTAAGWLRALCDCWDDVVPALFYWNQLKSANIPLSCSLLLALAATCQLQRLELSDHVFNECFVDGPRPSLYVVGPKADASAQLTHCLQLLRNCSALTQLRLSCTETRLQQEHLHMLAGLAALTHLEELDLQLSNGSWHHADALVEPDPLAHTQEVLRCVAQLTQLTSLTVKLEDFCTTGECVLGPMPRLRSLHVGLTFNEIGNGDAYCASYWGSAALGGCPLLETAVLCLAQLQVEATLSVLRRLVHLELPTYTMDDALVSALTVCPHLEILRLLQVKVMEACPGVLSALRELYVCNAFTCAVPLRVLAPKLCVLHACDTPRCAVFCLAALKGHEALRLLQLPVPYLLEIHPDSQSNCSAVASLTSLRCLRVVGIKPSSERLQGIRQGGGGGATDTGGIAVFPVVRLAPALLPWAGNVRELHVTLDGEEHQCSERLLVLLQAMPGLHTLRILGGTGIAGFMCGDARCELADSVVWGLTMAAGQMGQLERVEVDARLVLVAGRGLGGCSHVTVLLTGLVGAPRLSCVQLVVHEGVERKSVKGNGQKWSMHRAVLGAVVRARMLRQLGFHVEVV